MLCFPLYRRHIIPYLQLHHKNPITSAPLHLRDLIRLHFHTDPSDPAQYICPVSHKPFSPLHTHIVAIATTGNVYAADVVDELCVKAGVLEDLVTGEKFRKEDIITLQDPHNLKTSSVQRRVEDEAVEQKQTSGSTVAAATSPAALSRAAASSSSPASSFPAAPFVARSLHSSHHATASFTSTALTPVTANTRTALTDAEKREQQYAAIRKQKTIKAYARLVTNHGHINLILYASQTPHTTHNFLTLATRHYYDRTASHRLVAGFMVQFGDPTGTGRGGEGAFERKFDDEIVASLKHDDRGVLSMANSGANTNGSQFFITFAACPHLDGKHTVFGHVVGGMQALDAIEKAGDRGDSDDKKSGSSKGKVDEVRIERVEVYDNPFKDDWVARDAVTGEREDEVQRRAVEEKKQREDSERKPWFSRPVAVDREVERREIGYLIKAGDAGDGEGAGGGRKRKEGPVMPAPVNDEDEAILRLKKRQAISRAMTASRSGASQFNFGDW